MRDEKMAPLGESSEFGNPKNSCLGIIKEEAFFPPQQHLTGVTVEGKNFHMLPPTKRKMDGFLNPLVIVLQYPTLQLIKSLPGHVNFVVAFYQSQTATKCS
jgi:hypothetical protein